MLEKTNGNGGIVGRDSQKQEKVFLGISPTYLVRNLRT